MEDPTFEGMSAVKVEQDVDTIERVESESENDKESYEEEEEEEFDLEKFPVRELKFKLGKGYIAFNPLVSAIGIIMLWGLAIWNMVDPDGSNETLVGWRGSVTLYFTWFFIGARAVFFFFMCFIGFKYGHIKMGRKDEEPEFSTASFFFMIFSAGVGVGLLVFGVAEPQWHANSHWFAQAGYHSQDEIDMFAITLSVSNWAISGWAPYLVVSVCMGLAGHRFKLPFTFRSCLYPILGEYTWGWIGDVIDGFTIVSTVAGVCTSLGLGAVQLVVGYQFLGWVAEDASEDKITALQNATIWVITLIATMSVVSGLGKGVKLLATLAFVMGTFLMVMIFIMDDSKFIMNLNVQAVGMFLQHSILELNFWTDAFGQLREGGGRAVDGKASAVWWMDAWMIFYQAWWVSWSAFVGIFVARISRGRTLGEVIGYSFVAPIAYSILWFCTWGGIGLRQSRQALELEALGAAYFNNTKEFAVPGSDFCYDVPQGSVVVDGTTVFDNLVLGVTPVCKFDSSQADRTAMNVLDSFSFPDDLENGYGPFLVVFFLFTLAIYFVTSSDSGSLVVDHLSSNGRKKHHSIQRIFWAVTEGAVATSLLSAGGTKALQGVQAASIVCGLPFLVIMCYLLESIWVFVQHAGDPDVMEFIPSTNQAEFTMPVYGGIFNVFEFFFSAGSVNPKRVERGMHLPTSFQVSEFFKALFVPFISLYQILSVAYPQNNVTNLFTSVLYGIFHVTWVGLFAAFGANEALKAWGWGMLFCSAVFLGAIRSGFRGKYNLRSNLLGDFMASCFFWPQVMTQMRVHCEELGLQEVDGDEKRV